MLMSRKRLTLSKEPNTTKVSVASMVVSGLGTPKMCSRTQGAPSSPTAEMSLTTYH